MSVPTRVSGTVLLVRSATSTTHIHDGQGNTLARFRGHWPTPVGGTIELAVGKTPSDHTTMCLVVASVHTHMRFVNGQPAIDLILRTHPAPGGLAQKL